MDAVMLTVIINIQFLLFLHPGQNQVDVSIKAFFNFYVLTEFGNKTKDEAKEAQVKHFLTGPSRRILHGRLCSFLGSSDPEVEDGL